ncbi:MAG: hypothetical protein JSV84_12235 [Gemmatimonadota bacterium]|nr:MAG: hypothetical protein JSV84_12235 [Gemmatimonadota bacterium]
MTKALFKPFDIHKWLVVGFTAFLAGLTDWTGEGGSGGDGRGDADVEDVLNFPLVAWDWLLDHPGWFTLILFGFIFVIVLGILLTWLSSRGKFMFLDNVVHDRAQVVKPWYEFRGLGNSLFVWRLCFGVICFIVFMAFLVFSFFVFHHLYESYFPLWTTALSTLGLAVLALSLIVTAAYVALFLNDFVVPIMYKNNVTVIPAWGRFLQLFGRHLLHFLLYGILVLFFYVSVIICVILAGLMTCCIGFIFLIIPYINSVITLPISYTFRAFSLEFLEQFGPEFSIFPQPDETVPRTQT